MFMKHGRGINLIAENVNDPALTPERSSHAYRVEVWSEPPEAGREIIELIASSTNFNVSCAALRAAIHERPGKHLVHMNGRHRMSASSRRILPSTLSYGRSKCGSGRFLPRPAIRSHAHASGAA